jgi:hypothetical protein
MVSQTEQKFTNAWICVLCALTNLTQDMVSQTEQMSTNSWISVPCALTLSNPEFGQSERTEVQ